MKRGKFMILPGERVDGYVTGPFGITRRDGSWCVYLVQSGTAFKHLSHSKLDVVKRRVKALTAAFDWSGSIQDITQRISGEALRNETLNIVARVR